MEKVAIILGTRPEAIKLIPIYLEFKKSAQFKPVLISTGQHKTMLEQIFDFFEIKPDIELDVMQPNQTLSSLSAILFEKIGELFKNSDYDFVFVQGDTTTAFVGAMSAFYQKIPVAHVEAGLRTYNKYSPFPEEVNRELIGKIATIHFTPTKTASENLYKENIVKNVYCVGNSVIDSLLLAKEKVEKNRQKYLSVFENINLNKKVILVTGHRRESFGKGFEEICNALAEIAKKHEDIEIVYPVHLNPNVKEVVYKKLSQYKNIKLINPLPYDELIFLMSNSWLVMTDSGGIQEEAPAFDIPVIVMRDTTERMEGVEANCSVLGSTNSKKILEKFYEIYNSNENYLKMVRCQNPYGDGTTSKQIVEILKKRIIGC